VKGEEIAKYINNDRKELIIELTDFPSYIGKI
jgi:hypothetical protein